MNEYYNILQISPGATEEEIKIAYRKMAHKYHPDKPNGDEDKMKAINKAYRILTGKETIQQQPIVRRQQPQYANAWVVHIYRYDSRGFYGGDTDTTASTF